MRIKLNFGFIGRDGRLFRGRNLFLLFLLPCFLFNLLFPFLLRSLSRRSVLLSLLPCILQSLHPFQPYPFLFLPFSFLLHPVSFPREEKQPFVVPVQVFVVPGVVLLLLSDVFPLLGLL